MSDIELGYVRKGFHIAREELIAANLEIRRLRALIARAVVDFEEAGVNPGMIEWLDNETRQLVQCGCGKLWGHDELAWQDWADANIQIANCLICNSQLSRSYVR